MGRWRERTLATGLLLADANRVRGPMFIAAAEALASMVTEDDLAVGAVYPRIANIREAGGEKTRILYALYGVTSNHIHVFTLI